MNRRSLIKSILGLAAAPKILAEINFNPPMVAKGATTSLFKDLIFVVPDYMPKLIEKYGNTSWGLTADQFQNTWNKAQLEYFEKLKSNGNENKNI